VKCPSCKRFEDLHEVGTRGLVQSIWCSNCGSLTEFSDGRFFSVRKPTNIQTKHGLLTVADDAVQRAIRSIGRVEQLGHGTSSQTDAFWAITEALGAIIHELDAREDEREPTAAERHDERQAIHDRTVQRAIQVGVDAVHHERERCALLCEALAENCCSDPSIALLGAARDIRKVPT